MMWISVFCNSDGSPGLSDVKRVAVHTHMYVLCSAVRAATPIFLPLPADLALSRASSCSLTLAYSSLQRDECIVETVDLAVPTSWRSSVLWLSAGFPG